MSYPMHTLDTIAPIWFDEHTPPNDVVARVESVVEAEHKLFVKFLDRYDLDPYYGGTIDVRTEGCRPIDQPPPPYREQLPGLVVNVGLPATCSLATAGQRMRIATAGPEPSEAGPSWAEWITIETATIPSCGLAWLAGRVVEVETTGLRYVGWSVPAKSWLGWIKG